MAQPYVITLSRDFASMGRTIAQLLSQRLGCAFYDRDIVEQTARRMGLPVSVISDTEEAAHNLFYKRIYPLGMGVRSMQDEIFQVQKNIIRDLAAKENCIVVGRCADYVLKDLPHVLHVHIFAPEEQRFKNCVQKLEMEPEAARRTIARVDRARELYHQLYGGGDVFTNCHVMLNSSQFGVEGTARILEGIARDPLPVSKP